MTTMNLSELWLTTSEWTNKNLLTFIISSRKGGEHVSMPTESCSSLIKALQPHTTIRYKEY